MAYTVKDNAPCIGCGEPTRRRLRKSHDPCCLECAVELAEQSVHNLMSHRGPAYEKWQKGMSKFLANEGIGTPPPSSSNAE